MKVAIVGAGAIGVWLGAALSANDNAAKGVPVTALARGATLSALRTHGWRVLDADRVSAQPAHAAATPEEIGKQDVVIVAVKSASLPSVAIAITDLCHPETVIVPAMNGVPWWFLPSLDGHADDVPLNAVDPGGELLRTLPLARIVGCVVHAAASSPEPGLSSIAVKGRFVLGEPSGIFTPRLLALQRLFSDSGLNVSSTPNIQREVWTKLMSNMIFNPLSALTRASTSTLANDPLLRPLIENLHNEASRIAVRLNLTIEESLESRLHFVSKYGGFKTSMLQDLEAGRRLEIDALLRAPREIGARLGIATPTMDGLLGMIAILDQSLAK